jgi:hypothetical protein
MWTAYWNTAASSDGVMVFAKTKMTLNGRMNRFMGQIIIA